MNDDNMNFAPRSRRNSCASAPLPQINQYAFKTQKRKITQHLPLEFAPCQDSVMAVQEPISNDDVLHYIRNIKGIHTNVGLVQLLLNNMEPLQLESNNDREARERCYDTDESKKAWIDNVKHFFSTTCLRTTLNHLKDELNSPQTSTFAICSQGSDRQFQVCTSMQTMQTV